MKKFIAEFREFIARGNVIDMAVAVVVGGAFSKIISSLVNDIIMPLIGLVVGGTNISSLKWVIREAVYSDAGELVKSEAALTYGAFIQAVIDFLLIALCIFAALKLLLLAKDKILNPVLKHGETAEEEETSAEDKKETTEEILAEIRDMLRENK
ncbi:MAG: large conductance mechanosensitive channel protein MscL [Clostridiales bacterium]|nr:large conductance mechanosensitive channel protein MscL [Clostridiales bacterium]